MLRVGLCYDVRPAGRANPPDRWAEFDTRATVDRLLAAIEAGGFGAVDLGQPRDVLQQLPLHGMVDLVLSIAEGDRGRAREAWVPAMLEVAGVPYVGGGTTTLAIALDKWATKRLCQASGIPVPRGAAVAGAEPPAACATWRWPLLAKLRHEGSAMGLHAGSVVADWDGLCREVRRLWLLYAEPVLVEEFIVGGECTVLCVGNPPEPMPMIQRPVDRTSTIGAHVSGRLETAVTPLDLTPELEAHLQDLARRVCAVTGCRDVARVDLRVDGRGHAWVLEVNPLPSFASDDAVAWTAEVMGLSFEEIVGRIIRSAADRYGLC